MALQDALVEPAHGWTCFHCGEVFRARQAAQDHFGLTECEPPACVQVLTESEKAIIEDRREWRERALRVEAQNEQPEYELGSMKFDLRHCFDGATSMHEAKAFLEDVRGQIAAKDAYARLMITLATHAQGGHSDTGAEIAELLGIPFPLRMDGLSEAARNHGLDPDDLWPWLRKMRDGRQTDTATVMQPGDST